VFVGAVHEAMPALTALVDCGAQVVGVFTLSDRMAARTAGFVDLREPARRHGVPVFLTENLNADDVVERIHTLRPDLLVVVGWTRLLSDALLALPGRGCVGFHASLLPRHRGRAPVNWAILRGEPETGNTMMYLAAGVDTGDIIDQRVIPIEEEDTCGTVYEKVGAAGAEMLTAHLAGLLAGTAPRRPQVHGGADLLPKRTPAMGITDWSRPARAVHDWIRALTHPYPGAFTSLEGRKLYLWRSRTPAEGGPAGEPGELLGIEGDALRVGTLSGSLLVTEVQEEGMEEMSGAHWYDRRRPPANARFASVDPETARWALGLGPRPTNPEPF
jgi:methionyl-tRNA formyltransferase